MPLLNLIRPSFAGGEYAPALCSRVDIARYNIGAKLLRNMIVHPTGGTSNRTGFRYVATTKTDGKKVILVPFKFSTTQTYMLEFGEYYCRFYKDGGQIQSGGAAYEIVTPYAEDDLEDISFTQSADVLFLAHPDYPPRQINRFGDTDWTLTYFQFFNGPFRLPNTSNVTLAISATTGMAATLTAAAPAWVTATIYEVGDYVTETVTVYKCLIKHTAGTFANDLAASYWEAATLAVFDDEHVGALFQLHHYIEGQSANDALASVAAGTAISCGGTWRLITHGTWTGKIQVEKSIDGGTTWTCIRAFTSADDFNADTYGTEDTNGGTEPFQVRVNMTARTSGTCNADLSADPYLHSGIAKVTAFVDATEVTVNVERAFGSTDATADWAEGAWSFYRGYPSIVEFSPQDRLIFANNESEPQTYWASKVSNYYDFGVSNPLVDSDAISSPLPSRELNGINGIIALRNIIALTTSGECSIESSDGGPLTPSTLYNKIHGYEGSYGVRPVVIGNRAIYVQRVGSMIRDIGWEFSEDVFKGSDISVFANHLFNGYTIKQMAYQQNPDRLVWAVRSDGRLLSMTYMREQEVLAWTWHDTNFGIDKFESVAVIPTEGYDEVWVSVRRGSKRYIERLAKRMPTTDPRDQFFVDCGISYDSPKYITGVTQANPVVITSVAHGYSNGDTIDIANIVADGVPPGSSLDNMAAELNLKRYKVKNKTDDTYEITDEDDVDIDGTNFTNYVSGGESRVPIGKTTLVTGLDHLNGKTVSILADGNVLAQQVVASGQLAALDADYSRIHVGLQYYSDFESLNIDLSGPGGTIQGKKIQIPAVTFKLQNTRGGYKGPGDPELENAVALTPFAEPMRPTLGDPLSLYTCDQMESLGGGYQDGGRVFVRQSDPLPITILAIVPQVKVGGIAAS